MRVLWVGDGGLGLAVALAERLRNLEVVVCAGAPPVALAPRRASEVVALERLAQIEPPVLRIGRARRRAQWKEETRRHRPR